MNIPVAKVVEILVAEKTHGPTAAMVEVMRAAHSGPKRCKNGQISVFTRKMIIMGIV